MLPVLFSAGGAQTRSSPIRDAPSVIADAGNGQGVLLYTWDSETAVVAPPEAGSKIVDRAAGDGKLGAVVAVSPGEPRKRASNTPHWDFFFVTAAGLSCVECMYIWDWELRALPLATDVRPFCSLPRRLTND